MTKPVIPKSKQRNQQSEVLMQGHLTGDEAAFYQLVNLWKQPLVTYFYYQIREQTQAEDLAQEVFIRVYKSKNYQAQGQFSAWIYRIAQNMLRDHLRRKKLTLVSSDLHPHLLEGPSPAQEPGEALIQSEETQALYRVLALLSPQEQELIILSQIQALSYQEVADTFALPLSVIKGKIYRSVRKFVRRFQKEIQSHENP